MNGRGRISKRIPARHIHDGHEYWKDFGREVARDCLETIRCTEGLAVGSVFRKGDPSDVARTKRELYAELVAHFESELELDDSLGLVFMDATAPQLISDDPSRTRAGAAARHRGRHPH